MNWKYEVIADNSGKWCGNERVFATEDEAKIAVASLRRRWSLVRDTRVVPTEEAVN